MSLLDGIIPDIVGDLLDSSFLGATCVVHTKNGNSYNPITGTETDGTNMSADVDCSPPEGYSDSVIDGTRIEKNDMKIMIAATAWSELNSSHFGVKPHDGLKIVIDSDTYSIVRCTSLMSGTSDAAYEVQLRSV